MTFDISQYELQDTATLIVQNARGDGDLLVDGNQVKITLYGAGSAQNVAAQHRFDNASTARMQSAFRGKPVKNQAEAAEQDLIEKLVACTASIENFPIDGGARALYANPKLIYIRKQVQAFLADDANFLNSSMTN
jgi:hypothetical protein